MISITRCGYCCHLFKSYSPNIQNSDQRKELSVTEAEEKLGLNYDPLKYNEYLIAYDNKSRLDEYKKNQL